MRLTAALAMVVLATLATRQAANAAIIEDFTGYVSSSNDAAVPDGTDLTGQIQLNYYAPLEYGSVGSTFGWEIYNPGDINIFDFFVNAGSFSYAFGEAPQPSLVETGGYIQGSANEIYAYAQASISTPGGPLESADSFEISNPDESAPYTSDGTPIFTPGLSSASGYFVDPYGNNISYTVTSVTPVPVPATAWLLLGGLGALEIVRRRRPVA